MIVQFSSVGVKGLIPKFDGERIDLVSHLGADCARVRQAFRTAPVMR